MKSFIVVTIDGPAGSGKSTVARKLAKTLGFIHLNSGLLFRAVGLEAARRGGLEKFSAEQLASLARTLQFEFRIDPAGDTKFFLEGREPGAEISGEQAGDLASKIAVHGPLRQVLLEVQREVGKTGSLVLEGRDAGTVVFPDADLKFYLEASLDERARRRFEQLNGAGAVAHDAADSKLESVRRELGSRDHRDSTREIAPQVAATDAVVVDTMSLGADEVVQKLVGLIKERGLIRK